MRDGPLPGTSWAAGREFKRVLVAMVENKGPRGSGLGSRASLATDDAQPSTNPLGKEEGGSHQGAAQVEAPEVRGIAAPVVDEHETSAVRYEALQREHEQIQIVDL